MAQTAFLESKNRFEVLDGLRGVAAIMVVIFHVFETFSTGRFTQSVNHGYLAVDFFFVLSGFVVGYAYDDRWGKMRVRDFFKIRLIRLQPMLIVGMIVGAALYYFQGCDMFSSIHKTPVWIMLLVMLAGFVMLPLLPAMDIRGWKEMYPLNGPAWTLLIEYIANILYGLFIRKFSKKVLAVFVFLAACLLVRYAVFGPRGDVIGGWSFDSTQLNIGFTRMLYPFFAGLLLSRMGKTIHVKGGFWLCSLLIVVILTFPRIGGSGHLWMNGLYESFCIIAVFPLIVAIGAGSALKSGRLDKVCRFLGAVSYPLYITHYPLIYLYVSWVANHKVPMIQGLPAGLLLIAVAVAFAYACFKLYDEPVRNWLRKRFLTHEKTR